MLGSTNVILLFVFSLGAQLADANTTCVSTRTIVQTLQIGPTSTVYLSSSVSTAIVACRSCSLSIVAALDLRIVFAVYWAQNSY